LFLQLSYFGTDQSQVQRYLGGASTRESRLGLLFNGILKIPMQFSILFIGLLVFVFYLFEKPPVFFDQATLQRVEASEHRGELQALQAGWDEAFLERKARAQALVDADSDVNRAALRTADARVSELRGEARALVERAVPGASTKDGDFIFVSFVLAELPSGIVGLLLAVILLASMSSTASELSSLGATSALDLYKRLVHPTATDRHLRRAGQLLTVGWGLVALSFATFASLVDNLIQAVNILGSVFYGVILGIFLVGFTLPRVGGTATFVAALLAEAVVVTLYFRSDIGFLWFNAIGCALVIGLAVVAQLILGRRPAGGET
jgi:solute:Na+ symporter, SSS family